MPFRVGMVGVEQHAAYLLAGVDKSDKMELVGYVGKEEERAKLEQHQSKKGLPFFQNLDELLRGQDPDIIGISMVSAHQGPQIVKALKAGKHVITDKPLVTTRKDLEAVKDALAANPKLRLSMLLTLRSSPGYVELHNAVRGGRMGEVVNCYAKRSAQLRPESRPYWAFEYDLSGGPILDLVIHDIDAVRWITGLEFVSAVGHQANVNGFARGKFYDHSQAILVMNTGASLIVEGNRNVVPSFGGMDNRMTVVGTLGQIEIDAKGRVFQYTKEAGGEITALPKPEHLVVDFANCLESGMTPVVSTADVIKTMEVCLGAREALENGSRVALT